MLWREPLLIVSEVSSVMGNAVVGVMLRIVKHGLVPLG